MNPFEFSKAIGVITPSANLAVERVTTAVLADFQEVSAHYTRVPVTGAHDPGQREYHWGAMLETARLVADAEPDVIVWNATMGASFGLDVDRELCARITAATGIPATTAVLAAERQLRRLGARNIALVTPYDDTYQPNVVRGYEAAGFACRSEAHAGLRDNIAYCRLNALDIADLMERADPAAADAALISCTNMLGAPLCAEFESRYRVPVLDTTLSAVHEALRLAGVKDLTRGARWGRLFADPALA